MSAIVMTPGCVREASEKLDRLRKLYQFQAGLDGVDATHLKRINPAFSARVARDFEALPAYDASAFPAYGAMADEVKAQARLLYKSGYSMTLHYDECEPYANSDAMRADLYTMRHMHVLATTAGYGQASFVHHYRVEGERNVAIVDEPNPLLQHLIGFSSDTRPVLLNDLFRWVHDVFGHGIHPHQFGPLGEDNAYREHMTMFSPLAQRALTTETRGQNSWVNFGPHLQRPDGTFPKRGDADYVPPAERPFGEQKTGLLPEYALDLSDLSGYGTVSA